MNSSDNSLYSAGCKKKR